MSNLSKKLGKVVSIDEAKIHDHLGELVRGTVEESLNAMLDAEADVLCGAQRYERSPDRVDTRSGSYERQFHTNCLLATKIEPLHQYQLQCVAPS